MDRLGSFLIGVLGTLIIGMIGGLKIGWLLFWGIIELIGDMRGVWWLDEWGDGVWDVWWLWIDVEG